MPEESGMSPGSPPEPATVVRSAGPVVPEKARWNGRLAARLIWLIVRSVSLTLRWELDDRSGLIRGDGKQRLIFAIWHNRLALSLELYNKYVVTQHPERKMAALVSASRDGGLLARVLELFGTQPIRGSSSRRGSRALREIVAAGADGFDLAITPDGPRGPCYSMRDGVVAAGQLTGLPILPVSYHLSAKWRLRSWDRFQIPVPFCRCRVTVGEAVWAGPDLDDAARETLRAKLQASLLAITADE